MSKLLCCGLSRMMERPYRAGIGIRRNRIDTGAGAPRVISRFPLQITLSRVSLQVKLGIGR